MRKLSGALLVCVLLFISCARERATNQNAAVPAAQPTVANIPTPAVPAAEPGDSSTPDFEGVRGVTEQKREGQEVAVLRDVRTGGHQNYDRMVFEFADGRVPGYRIEYKEPPVKNCGEGREIEVDGKAMLVIQLTPAAAHDAKGMVTINERERVLPLKMMRELKLICDFEAEVTWLVGTSASNRYRVLELANPARLVVDVRHSQIN